MNYFAHALHHLDRPWFVAGTAVPDWLSVADRQVRLRPRQLQPWLDCDDSVQALLAAGAAQHLHDDGWFHATRGFVEVTGEMTRLFRDRLGGDDRYHCGFLGHVGMELLLDAALIERYPAAFERYYEVLAGIDPLAVETRVNRMAREPARRLAWFIDAFRQTQFLRDYADDQRLLARLNQVLQRVKLSPLPVAALQPLAASRILVRQRIEDLLPAEHYGLAAGHRGIVIESTAIATEEQRT